MVYSKYMNNILVFLKDRRVIVLLLLAAGGVAFFGFRYVQDQKELQYLQGLTGKHPNGETYVAEILKARMDLKDKNKSNDFAGYVVLGVNLNLLGEKQAALNWYEKAFLIDPISPLVLNNMANIYSDLRQYEKSEATWLKLIGAYPNKPSFYRSLGYLYRYRLYKSSDEIEALFKKGLVVTNNDPDLLTWLIAYFQETGNNEKFAQYANLLNEQSKR